jgi:hypothetical protein
MSCIPGRKAVIPIAGSQALKRNLAEEIAVLAKLYLRPAKRISIEPGGPYNRSVVMPMRQKARYRSVLKELPREPVPGHVVWFTTYARVRQVPVLECGNVSIAIAARRATRPNGLSVMSGLYSKIDRSPSE